MARSPFASIDEATIRDPLIASSETRVTDVIAQMSDYTHFTSINPSIDPLRLNRLEARSSCVVGVDKGHVVGIVTERDIVRLQAEYASLDGLTMGQIMTAPVVIAREADLTDVSAILKVFQLHQIHHLPILNEHDLLVGLVTSETLLHAIHLQECSQYKSSEADRRDGEAEHQQTEALLQTQNVLLAKIARDEPLETVLKDLIQFLEQQLPGAICSVLLLDDDDRLRIGAAPNLPHAYNDAIHGIKIGAGVGSCGTAAFRRETVIVADVANHPFWQGFKELACQHGLRACWSSPILASDNRALGTFAVYYRQAQSPEASELGLISQVANIAGIAIEREHTRLTLQKNEERYSLATRAARVGVWEWNIKTNYFYLDPNVKALLGYTDAEIPNDLEYWVTFVHPDDRTAVMAAAQAHLDGETPEYVSEHRMLHKNGSTVWILVRGQVLRDAEGNPERMFGTDTDISDRKKLEAERKYAEILLQRLVESTAATIGQDFFPTLVGQMAKALDVSYAFVAEKIDNQLQTLAFWANDSLQPTTVYSLPNTPCEQALQHGVFYCDRHVQNAFPEAPSLAELGAESYLGIALLDNQGQVIGNLCILDQKPIRDPQQAENLLRIFGARAAVELERQRANTLLSELNQDLEIRVAERTADLQESQYFLEQIAESSPAILYIYDLINQRNVYVNGQIQNILGYSPEAIQAMGSNFFTHLVHPDDVAMLMERVAKCLTQEDFAVTNVEYRMRHANGEWRWLQSRDRVFRRTLAGSPWQMIGTAMDISDRKVAEIALQEREKLLDLFFSQSLDGFFFMMLDQPIDWEKSLDQDALIEEVFAHQRITRVNDALLSQYRSTAEQILGMTPNDLFAHDLEHGKQRWKQFFNAGRLHIETEEMRLDGTPITIEGDYVCLYDREGRITGHFGIQRDISDRKLAEQQLQHLNEQLEIKVFERTALLQEREQFLQTVLDTFPLSVFWKNRSLNYLGCNRNFLRDAGLNDVAEITGKTDFDMPWGQTEADNYRADDRHVMETNTPKIGIIETQVQSDGNQIWLETNKLPLHNLQGDVVGVLGTYRDISARVQLEAERKRAEEQLQATHEALILATKLKDEFLANMSHELRTPLNAILGMTEALLDGMIGSINAGQSKALETIERSGNHLLALINDILDVAKIESGKITLDPVLTSVPVLCQSSLTFVQSQAAKKRIQLQQNLPDNLPPVWVDERRFIQILTNLLSNAVKFTPDGGTVTLDVSYQPAAIAPGTTLPPNSEPSQASLRIAITDTGIGIAPSDLEKLFQPFVQIDGSLNRQHNGTGLGLTLVKRLIELHNGHVEVTTQVGAGSCFAITIPCATTELSPSQWPLAISPNINLHLPDPDEPTLVLLVEDNAVNAQTITSYLRAKGYDLLWAKNAQEGITFAQAEKPHIILMDIQMPGMDGLEATQRIRQDPRLVNVPIIALTGLAMDGDLDRCLAAGANDYLSKPIRLKQLGNKIQQLLSHA